MTEEAPLPLNITRKNVSSLSSDNLLGETPHQYGEQEVVRVLQPEDWSEQLKGMLPKKP